jgi:hypothetical protein
MATLHTRVAKHGRSTVLVVPPAEAKKARLRAGQKLPVMPITEKEEPWLGSWKKLGIGKKDWTAAEKGMWD